MKKPKQYVATLKEPKQYRSFNGKKYTGVAIKIFGTWYAHFVPNKSGRCRGRCYPCRNYKTAAELAQKFSSL
jgi:hypothetical protein